MTKHIICVWRKRRICNIEIFFLVWSSSKVQPLHSVRYSILQSISSFFRKDLMVFIRCKPSTIVSRPSSYWLKYIDGSGKPSRIDSINRLWRVLSQTKWRWKLGVISKSSLSINSINWFNANGLFSTYIWFGVYPGFFFSSSELSLISNPWDKASVSFTESSLRRSEIEFSSSTNRTELSTRASNPVSESRFKLRIISFSLSSLPTSRYLSSSLIKAKLISLLWPSIVNLTSSSFIFLL